VRQFHPSMVGLLIPRRVTLTAVSDRANFFLPGHPITEGHHIAQQLGCRFVETSAKLGTNVSETFMGLVDQIRNHNKVCLKFYSILFSFFRGVSIMAIPMTLHLRPLLYIGTTADAPGYTGNHPRQHQIARRRVLEQQHMHPFLIPGTTTHCPWHALCSARPLAHSILLHSDVTCLHSVLPLPWFICNLCAMEGMSDSPSHRSCFGLR
jgi:hypothetical protein